MILKNKSGQKRKFQILFETIQNNKKYVVYRDLITDNIYGGRIVKDKLKPLNDNEYKLLDNIIEKFN